MSLELVTSYYEEPIEPFLHLVTPEERPEPGRANFHIVTPDERPDEVFVNNEEQTPLQYALEFDVKAYQDLLLLKQSDPEQYVIEKEKLDGLTTFNLITSLGERLNAAVSRRVDILEDGIMKDSITKKPLIEWYEKGRQARLASDNSIHRVHNSKRELAEIFGQMDIQTDIANSPKGTIKMSPSLPGGSYQHRFADFFHKSEENEITVVRAMISLDESDMAEKIRLLNPNHSLSEQPDDIDFLTHPVTILPGTTPFQTPDEIHAFLQDGIDDAMSEAEFERVKNACMPYIRRYLIVLATSPHLIDLLGRSYNAILNRADEERVEIKAEKEEHREARESYQDSGIAATYRAMMLLGSQQVRAVDTGCGFSGGASIGPMSVSDFSGVLVDGWAESDQDDPDVHGTLFFNCPRGHRVKRPKHVLLPKCPFRGCGVDVRCDAPIDIDVVRKRKAEAKKRAERDELFLRRQRKEEEIIFARKKAA